jgi:hypothetical protein
MRVFPNLLVPLHGRPDGVLVHSPGELLRSIIRDFNQAAMAIDEAGLDIVGEASTIRTVLYRLRSCHHQFITAYASFEGDPGVEAFAGTSVDMLKIRKELHVHEEHLLLQLERMQPGAPSLARQPIGWHALRYYVDEMHWGPLKISQELSNAFGDYVPAGWIAHLIRLYGLVDYDDLQGAVPSGGRDDAFEDLARLLREGGVASLEISPSF